MIALLASALLSLAVGCERGNGVVEPCRQLLRPTAVSTRTHISEEVEKGEVCVFVNGDPYSCFQVGKGEGFLFLRKFTIRETSEISARMVYWNPQTKQWVTVQTVATVIEVHVE